jgi:hypothetical protein
MFAAIVVAISAHVFLIVAEEIPSRTPARWHMRQMSGDGGCSGEQLHNGFAEK